MQGMNGQTVTVTGCLVREADLQGAAASSTTGSTTSAAAGAAASGANFVLANVQMRSTSPTGTTGSTSATGGEAAATAPSGARGTNLKLTASGDEKLSEHVNKQVEVTGRLSMSDAHGASAAGATTSGTTGAPATGTTGSGTAGSTAGAATAARTGAAASGHDNMGQLQVQSIRATGQSCTAKQ